MAKNMGRTRLHQKCNVVGSKQKKTAKTSANVYTPLTRDPAFDYKFLKPGAKRHWKYTDTTVNAQEFRPFTKGSFKHVPDTATNRHDYPISCLTKIMSQISIYVFSVHIFITHFQ